VAHFIGDANLLDGVVERLEDGAVVVRVGRVAVRARRQGWEQVGSRLTVCIRPERVRMDSSMTQPDALRGRVEDRAFSGYVVKYRLAVGDLRMNAVVPYLNGTPLHQVGDEVTAHWDPQQAVGVARE
jgi:ABC-type Fe3+/spermidine/putrescine transport system ATPase subunit